MHSSAATDVASTSDGNTAMSPEQSSPGISAWGRAPRNSIRSATPSSAASPSIRSLSGPSPMTITSTSAPATISGNARTKYSTPFFGKSLRGTTSRRRPSARGMAPSTGLKIPVSTPLTSVSTEMVGPRLSPTSAISLLAAKL